MSDGTPFGTKQSFQPGKTSATKSIGSMVQSLGNRAIQAVRGDRAMQKQWEFAASLHAHNEGISHHYAMERMQADHEMQTTRMKEGGRIDRAKIRTSASEGRKSVEHAAGVAQSMPGHNVSMKAGSDGGFEFSSQKAPASRTPRKAPAAKKPAPKAAPPATPASTEEPPSAAKPPNTRGEARQMSDSNGSKKASSQGVTTPRKTRTPKPPVE
jgi:hypothetical protein